MKHARTTRGFTLLEVLLAVVVLAFGLLGLVAVFPAVIDLQRRAQDVVIGGSQAASAEALLRASLLENDSLSWIDWENDPVAEDFAPEDRFPARGVLTLDRGMNAADVTPNNATVEIASFEWETDWEWLGSDDDVAGELLGNGLLRLGGGQGTLADTGNAGNLGGGGGANYLELPRIDLPISQRLLPAGGSGDAPRYVWDAVVRRVDAGFGTRLPNGRRELTFAEVSQLPVEMAIFVRPIDRGIRVPAGLTLRDTLRGFTVSVDAGTGEATREDLADADRRYPVAVLSGDFAVPVPGLRLSDTDARYSVPVQVRLPSAAGAIDGDDRAPLRVINLRTLRRNGNIDGAALTADGVRRSLGRVGQKFVSSAGLVHEVVRVIGDDNDVPERIEIEPPMPAGAEQIVFTPQVPARIVLVRTP